MSKFDNILKLQEFEIDVSNNNLITIVLDDNTITIFDEVFEHVDFITMEILTSTKISDKESLIEYAEKHKHFEVSIKQINMDKIGVPIITKFIGIIFSTNEDTYVANIKYDIPVKTLLGSDILYEGDVGYNINLYKNYLESTDAVEFIIEIEIKDYKIFMTYGDIYCKNLNVDFNCCYNISCSKINNANNKKPDWQYEFCVDNNINELPREVCEFAKLLNRDSIMLIFGHLLQGY